MLKSLACFIFIVGLFSRMIFSRQAAKVAKELFRRNLCVLCALARASLTAGYFFSPSRKDRKDLHTPRSLCALRAFARGRNSIRAILSSCGNLSRQAAKIAKHFLPLPGDIIQVEP